MTKHRKQRIDFVDSAIEAIRETPVPDGPHAELVSTLLRTGRDVDEKIKLHLNHERKTIMKRVLRTSVAAVVMIAVGVLTSFSLSDQNGNAAFAEVLANIRKAKSATYTYTHVYKVSNRDKSKTWHERETHKVYYKMPGRSRNERLDKNGKVDFVEIDDAIAGKHLELWPEEKRAKLINRTPISPKNRKWLSDDLTQLVGKLHGDAVSLGKKKIDGREANGYRMLQAKSNKNSSADLWIDAKTEKLVYALIPGAHKFDPETDPARNNAPGNRFRNATGALVFRNIVFDAKLDDSMFSTEPPKGFVAERKTKHEPTEKDVIEWFGILAECYGGQFPEKHLIDIDRVNAILKKRFNTPAEKRIIEQQNQADLGLVYCFPIARFVEHSGGDNWHYAGNGVTLGDKTKAIFWYKPKGAKTFRAIYGDLSVKDVAAEKVPPREKE